MIQKDQPTIFGNSITAAVSSVEDGQMQHGWLEADDDVNANREAFLLQNGLSMDSTVLVRVKYGEGATYDLIKDVSMDDAGSGMYERSGVAADCLITNTPGLGLFLPVADCGATIVFDPIKHVLALVHLGRHSTVAELASKLIGYMVKKYGSDPSSIKVWMSPSIKKSHYLLKTADFAVNSPKWKPYYSQVDSGYLVDIQGYNKNLFMKSGVPQSQIVISDIDTAEDPSYWSHFMSTTMSGEVAPPRFAVVAALKSN